MKLLTYLIAASLGLLAMLPGAALAQAELPYTLTQGSYEGSFVRVAAADGETPQRGDVRLELRSDGGLFGVFYAPVASASAPAGFVSFQGQIDPATRRGFLRVLRSDTPGGPLYPVPGAEKLALFLYPDGRLVGGGLDAQGRATALRATFLPLTPLPVGPSTP